ncbi:MAG: hypothetical protein ACE37I_19345 [Rubinisphaera brasiliensis]|uniref:Lipoprotein n=1 Tax=Rubinisphaera brasiliensis (strain ATCC 49424 / DSM 5305 / JCM 21570 / IAM 15109 / NBRC 103401 / IFAM 1448) TaxID=756272 RepID=F0SQG1_RUBBR|nr:hypothetical protein [Rubinisphaera brasiliensis]ADY57936.1 hypothetical protein Plabr_0307 [Rubinisphaera brasiliensis DSM 5305]MBR9804261.1 hypothetical protein [bacterium]
MKKLMGCAALLVAFSASTAMAEGWGTIKGKIVVDGDAPSTTPLVEEGANVKDANVCAVKDIPDDSLVVGKDGGLGNCFIYLYSRRGAPDIHPDLQKPAEATVKLDNEQCRFVPHAGIVRADQKINCINSDACGHNVHTFPLKNNAHNLLISANDEKGVELEFNQGELLPMQVKCDIHPWMTSYWMVVEHPYAVVSSEDGTFTIEKLPAGEHTFRIWHERVGYVERSLDVEVEDGKTIDLGVIEVDAKDLES